MKRCGARTPLEFSGRKPGADGFPARNAPVKFYDLVVQRPSFGPAPLSEK